MNSNKKVVPVSQFALPKPLSAKSTKHAIPLTSEQRSEASRKAAKVAWGKMYTALWQFDHATAIVSQITALKATDKKAFAAQATNLAKYNAIIAKTRATATAQRKLSREAYAKVCVSAYTAHKAA
jgi:hypothetical protein